VWPQLVAFALGIWLTASPDVLGYDDQARRNAQIFGPLAATFALVAVFEVTRPVRWLNLPLGLWLVFAPWLLVYRPTETVNTTAVGIGLMTLACVRGRVTEPLGGGWRVLWRVHDTPTAARNP
jgi:hypothetical protein